ncbi:MAG: hypothetical protein AAF603_00660, partial [Pseudomonadota bacterium]
WLMASRPEYDLDTISFDPAMFTIDTYNLDKVSSFIDLKDDPEDLPKWSTYAKELTWRPSLFDDIFLKIAEDEEYGITFAKLDMSLLLAPYDGGFDLILPSSNKVQEWRNKFKEWLPYEGGFL